MKAAWSSADTQLEDTQLEELSENECWLQLALTPIGRIAFIVDGRPVVLPVNYRLLGRESGLGLIIRTRSGNAIDRAPGHVAFEIDGIDPEHERGWSVLVSGVLRHLEPDEIKRFSNGFDPKPWPQRQRTSWLCIAPQAVSGRRLNAAERDWALPSDAYL